MNFISVYGENERIIPAVFDLLKQGYHLGIHSHAVLFPGQKEPQEPRWWSVPVPELSDMTAVFESAFGPKGPSLEACDEICGRNRRTPVVFVTGILKDTHPGCWGDPYKKMFIIPEEAFFKKGKLVRPSPLHGILKAYAPMSSHPFTPPPAPGL